MENLKKMQEMVQKYHNLPGKAEWVIIDTNGKLSIGLRSSQGSKVCLDLMSRRFYSLVELIEVYRKAYPARVLPTSEKDMIVFEATDNASKNIVLPKDFIEKIYSTTIYGTWMERDLLL